MAIKRNGGLLHRLQLAGLPYWFGTSSTTFMGGLMALAIAAVTVYGLTVAVRTGANGIVGWFKVLQPQALIGMLPDYAGVGVVLVGFLICLAWFYGRKKDGVPEAPYSSKDARRERLIAWGLLAAVLSFMVAVNILNVVINQISGLFTTALNQKNEVVYWKYLYLYAAIFLPGLPIVVYSTWFQRVLFNHWRRWLTHYLLDKYFGGDRAFYRINGRQDIDNPDERIHQDVQNFVDGALSLLLTVLGSLITIVSFSGILWSMSGTLTGAVYIYAAVGSVITIVFGRILVAINGLQLKYEADFRFGITHVRNNAESIAFYHGEEHENEQIRKGFQYVYRNYLRLVNAQRNLMFFTRGFDYAVIIIPSLFLAPLFFKGEVEIGVITQATMAFRLILGSLEVIVSEFRTITVFAANVQRIGAFVEALDDVSHKDKAERIGAEYGESIELKDVTLKTPDRKQTLVEHVSFKVSADEPLLIVGPSGSGKTSMLRLMAGLWDDGTGTIVLPIRPGDTPDVKKMLFLPQSPYMVRGKLRDQLTYPNRDAVVSDAQLEAVLDEVRLHGLEKRFEKGFDEYRLMWKENLSLGQQQRLAIARLILTDPRIAVLDEATSALDPDNEANVYESLRKRKVTYVSVGHRPALVRYHKNVLELKGDGKNWELMPAAEYARRQAELGGIK
jgi:putative ATP-binding cassette transporter